MPGRGAHVCRTTTCIEGLRKGGLSRSFKTQVKVPPPPWPLDAVLERTRKRQRELVGLAQRAGVLKSGGNVVSGLVAKGWPKYLVLASDAGERVRADLVERAERRSIPIFTSLLGAEELGNALGRASSRSVAAVGSGGPSSALRNALKHGAAFI